MNCLNSIELYSNQTLESLEQGETLDLFELETWNHSIDFWFTSW